MTSKPPETAPIDAALARSAQRVSDALTRLAMIEQTRNPIRSIYVYSRPEWTALVAPKGSSIAGPADLKGKRIAVTRGTDPHIFLIQALAGVGLSEKDVKIVLLQHADGRLALQRGDIDAWAGLDPMMAAAEVAEGAKLFYRRPELNSWGVLNVREEFAAKNPALVKRVLATYEMARDISRKELAVLKAALLAAAKLPEPVIERQMQRTDLSECAIGAKQKATVLAAGLALQQAGVIEAKVNVPAVVDALIDGSYAVAGFGLGVLAGTLIGALAGYSGLARRLLDPSLQGLRSIPSIAWVPLFILWLGIFEASKIALIAVGVFFPVYLGVLGGILTADRKIVEVGRIFRLSGFALVRRILLPAILPSYVIALRSGLGLGWMFVVAAEFMGASEGLGYLLVDGQQLGKPDQIVAAILAFAILGKLADGLLVALTRPLLRWQHAYVGGR